MSDSQGSIGAVSPSTPSPLAQAAAVSQDQVTAAGAVSSNKEPSINQTIGSMDELRKKAPKVYNQMLLGIATNICSEMQRHQARLKEIMRKGQG